MLESFICYLASLITTGTLLGTIVGGTTADGNDFVFGKCHELDVGRSPQSPGWLISRVKQQEAWALKVRFKENIMIKKN